VTLLFKDPNFSRSVGKDASKAATLELVLLRRDKAWDTPEGGGGMEMKKAGAQA